MATFIKIASSTVGAGGVASVTFSSIPQTGYTDLVVKASLRTTSGNTDATIMSFNGSTTGYTARVLEGTGSGFNAFAPTPQYFAGTYQPSNYTASIFSSHDIYIPNYTSSNSKSWSVDSTTENNATASIIDLTAGVWANSSAITSIVFSLAQGNIAQYSTFTLYGIKNS